MANQFAAARRPTLIVILFLAAGLRFHRLGAQSFWNDEGNSARLSERSIQLILEGTASDIHPPLYYLILRGWRELTGDSEFGLRSFSAMVGLATVALTINLAAYLGRRRSAPGTTVIPLAAGLLVALNPALIYYSQEARMYALLAFLALLSTLLLVRWLTAVRSWRLAAGYLLCASAGLYTHYAFPATLLAQNLIVFGWLSWQAWVRQASAPSVSDAGLRPVIIRWGGLMAATFLIYLPWFPIFLRQTGGRAVMRSSLIDFLQDSGYFISFGPTIQAAEVHWPFLAALLLLIVGIINGRRWATVAITSLFLPLLLMYLTGATQPEFFKFMLVSIPFLAILQGLSWQGTFPQMRWIRWLLLLPLLALLWGNLQALRNLYFDPAYARDDYRAMAARIAKEADPNAGIILSAPNQWEVFTYYHREGAPVYPIPTGRPDPGRIEAELQAIARRHDRLYALFWGELQQDPKGLVERWLDTHTFQVGEEWVGDVRFVTYAVPAAMSRDMTSIAGWRFGEQITLDGYTVAADRLTPGDILQVTLFWQIDEQIERRYKIFLHLVDEQGRLIAQQDSEPGGGSRPTSTWRPQETITDNHGILVPAGSDPGQYTLRLGLYDLNDPTDRLLIDAPTGPTDAVSLAEIIIE